MATKTTDKKNIREAYDWTPVLFVDLYPPPGSFCSTRFYPYQVEGETIEAANPLHADYIWLMSQVEASGDEFGICHRCHQPIRYAIGFRDEEGRVHMVGTDCAKMIKSKLNAEDFAEKQMLSEVKAINTKNGPRHVLGMKVPEWYWNIPRERRPSFCSTSSYVKPGRKREKVWYLSIWGENANECILGYYELRRIQDEIKAGN